MAPVSGTSVVAKPFLAAVGKLDKEKQKLHASIVRTLAECTPGWSDVNADDVSVHHVGGAMTNLIFTVSKPTGENAEVLVRIYGEGTDAFFVRTDEKRLFELLSSKDIGIRLLGEFGNGRVEQLIHGTTLTNREMRSPKLSAQIARQMNVFHHLDVAIDRTPRFLSEIRRLLDVARTKCVGPQFANNAVDWDAVATDIDTMEALLADVPSPLVLSHNDLQYGNIMKTTSDDNSTNTSNIVLIDFEYTSYNPRGFDIGNHFCEWAFDYHKTINPHLGDFSKKYPSVDQQRAFCRAYLAQEAGVVDSDDAADDAAVDALRREASAYSLASHMFWGLWGYIQASQSEIDFDFFGYAQSRYNAFTSRVTYQQ